MTDDLEGRAARWRTFGERALYESPQIWAAAFSIASVRVADEMIIASYET
jgi:hypothetical protein